MTPPRTRATAVALALFLFLLVAHLSFRCIRRLDRRRDPERASASAEGERNLFPFPSLRHMGHPVDADAGESRYPYSVLIVSYHKTGHDLQMDLFDAIVNEFPGLGPAAGEFGNKSPERRRRHRPNIPCTRFRLATGTIAVQHAPDLFCTPSELAQLLLEGGHNHTTYDRGVKVVHLVRNPFSMAVSNYHYHARVPTPEPWVRFQDPCDTTIHNGMDHKDKEVKESYGDFVVPTLSKMSYQSIGVSFGGKQLLTREEFDAIVSDCRSLYRSRDELREKSFLYHLMNYDPPEGLRLATAEMTIQGDDNGGDILRMANNMIKLKQTQIRVLNSMEWQAKGKNLMVHTMSLDDFIARPAPSALKFFDFVFEGTGATVEQKKAAAMNYERRYYEKTKVSKHVTHGKAADTEQLKEYLRHDPAFGPPFSKIEMLVEAALAESRSR